MLHACASTQPAATPQQPAETETDDLKSLFNTKDVRVCKNLQPVLEPQGRLQSAKLFWNEKGEPKLIYQAAFRDEVKSVFQPLEGTSLSAQKDGIRLGPKGASAVVDFDLSLDDEGNTWASYRFQSDNKSPFVGIVEFVEKNSAVRREFKIPVANKETTITKIWTIASPKKGRRHVLVRTSRIDFSKTTADSGIYTWYVLDVQKPKMVQMAVFKNEHGNLESTTFLLHPKLDEPIAFGIEQRALDEEATTAAARKSQFRVVAKRIFSPRKEQSTIAEANELITQLDAAKINANEFAVAWLREGSSGEQSHIEWLAVTSDELMAPSQRKSAQSIRVDYTVHSLEILSAKTKGPSQRTMPWTISWQASAANRQAFMWLSVLKPSRAYATYVLPQNVRLLHSDTSQPHFHFLTTDANANSGSQKITDCTFH